MALINCPECGEKISTYTKQCKYCGFRFNVCDECGSILAHDSTVCSQCGKDVSAENDEEKTSEAMSVILNWDKNSLKEGKWKALSYSRWVLLALALAAYLAMLIVVIVTLKPPSTPFIVMCGIGLVMIVIPLGINDFIVIKKITTLKNYLIANKVDFAEALLQFGGVESKDLSSRLSFAYLKRAIYLVQKGSSGGIYIVLSVIYLTFTTAGLIITFFGYVYGFNTIMAVIGPILLLISKPIVNIAYSKIDKNVNASSL